MVERGGSLLLGERFSREFFFRSLFRCCWMDQNLLEARAVLDTAERGFFFLFLFTVLFILLL